MREERLLAEALRAQAAQGTQADPGLLRGPGTGPPPRPPLGIGWIVAIALLAGAVCGAALAALTLLAL